MVDNIIKFVSILRDMNVRISIAESIDAIKSLDYISLEDKEDFKITLSSTLIKNLEDREKFNKLFDIFFIYKEETQTLEFNQEDFEDMFAQMQDMFDDNYNDVGEEKQVESLDNPQPQENNNLNTNLDNKTDMFKYGGEEELKKEAKQIADKMQYNQQSVSNDIEKELLKQGYETGKTQATNNQNEELVKEKYEKLKDLIKEELEKNEIRKHGDAAIKDIMKEEYDDIYEKDFLDFDKDDIITIKKLLSKFVKKLNNIYIRKKMNSRKGSIDIKKTIKQSIKSGVVKDIFYKKRKKDKNNLVVLCDISGSMINYVKFILQIVIGIEQVFQDVRIYVFMEKLKDVTDEIKESEDVLNTVEHIYKTANLGFGTDYSNTFYWLNRKPFDKKTRLIVIGDGINGSFEDDGTESLFNIQQKCKCIYWLNPVKEEEWDNKFLNYIPYCNEVFECSNLRELENVMRKII
jgi:hypothetical protein